MSIKHPQSRTTHTKLSQSEHAQHSLMTFLYSAVGVAFKKEVSYPKQCLDIYTH